MVLAIVSFGVALIFLGVFLVFSLVSYFDQNKKKYDFRNCFPYEINNYVVTRDNIFGRIALIISAIAIIFFYSTYPLGNLTSYHFGLAVFVSILGIISTAAMLLIVFVPFLNLKLHLAGDIALFSSTFMLNIGIAFLSLWELKDNTVSVNILKTIVGVIALIISVFLIILVMNSKMKDWSKLKEKTSEDGTITYDRPRWFVLAYTEWTYILVLFVDLLLLALIQN